MPRSLFSAQLRQLIAFLAAGGTAAVINIGSRWLCSHWLPYVPAIVIGYAFGLASAFVLFRAAVFTSVQHHKTGHEIFFFVFVNLVGLLQTLAVSLALAEYILPALGWNWHRLDVAHATGVVSTAAASYLGHKHITFKERPPCV